MKEREEPLISIIIPTFNRGYLLRETLDSLLRQTYLNWECIIIDDVSTDNTKEVVETYLSQDLRFKYYERPEHKPKGANACRNYGFEKSKGEYIQWFDSDDLMHSTKLEIDLKKIQSGDYDFTISQSDFFDEEGRQLNNYWNTKLWSKNPINKFIKLKIGWGINSPLWRKESLKNADIRFDERLQSGQDYLFHIQALSKKMKPIVIEKVLVHQRSHNNKIEHTVVKSKSKALIYYYILKHKKYLEIDDNTLYYLENKSMQVVCNLYKTKNWKSALNFSLKLITLPVRFKLILKIMKLLVVGFCYQITSKGYNFIK